MTGYIGQKTKTSNLLPEIDRNTQRNLIIETEEPIDPSGEDDPSAKSAKGIVVKKLSDSEINLSERALAGLIDPNDKEEQRIEKMQ